MFADAPGRGAASGAGVYDVCIVGTGICGLNALFVAAKVLGRQGSVAFADRRQQVGGMWNDTYDYVRLHQPHPLFTAGNIKWNLDKDPAYLATKPEVLGHLRHCLDVLKKRIGVDEYFGAEYVTHTEIDDLVQTTFRRGDELVVVRSRKLIKAFGHNVQRNEPLPLTSTRVHSVSPDSCDVRVGEFAASSTPVWVIGGSKTGIDTAHAIISASPDREVNLVAGSGTFFISRDEYFPTRNKWVNGTRSTTITKYWRRFDGTNADEVHAAYRSAACIDVTPSASNWFAGLLSEAEAATVRDGLNTTVMGHLVDAVDDGESVQLVMRDGTEIAIEPGAWIVNCTGYLYSETAMLPYEPFVSPSGNVASINDRSATGMYTTFAAYFLTHLLLRNRLHRLPLYELDVTELRRQTNVAPTGAIAVFIYNLAVFADALPPMVFIQWGTNYDRWFPAPRWLWGLTSFFLTRRRSRENAAIAVETLVERYGVRGGPLNARDGNAKSPESDEDRGLLHG